mmetsp:Transcript_66873/g.207114  ORF Transcript_66873/g.207114 Transcript_66873/m.207114 type:complete len:250 (+) Transcript_66873:1222-1971(+)
MDFKSSLTCWPPATRRTGAIASLARLPPRQLGRRSTNRSPTACASRRLSASALDSAALPARWRASELSASCRRALAASASWCSKRSRRGPRRAAGCGGGRLRNHSRQPRAAASARMCARPKRRSSANSRARSPPASAAIPRKVLPRSSICLENSTLSSPTSRQATRSSATVLESASKLLARDTSAKLRCSSPPALLKTPASPCTPAVSWEAAFMVKDMRSAAATTRPTSGSWLEICRSSLATWHCSLRC